MTQPQQSYIGPNDVAYIGVRVSEDPAQRSQDEYRRPCGRCGQDVWLNPEGFQNALSRLGDGGAVKIVCLVCADRR